MYMFPRQFGLHNVFTSEVDRSQTAQKFQDYTMREDQIGPRFLDPDDRNRAVQPKIPKRLRGEARQLVQRLQILHERCSYVQLLDHYCPITLKCLTSRAQSVASRVKTPASASHASQAMSQSRHSRKPDRRYRRQALRQASQLATKCDHKAVVDMAVPISSVSAFCRATMAKIIPNAFWGSDQDQNKQVFLQKVDHFIRLRRFESISLHEISQGFKVSSNAQNHGLRSC